MRIPAFFAVHKDGELMATDGRFSGHRALKGERTVSLSSAVAEGSIKECRAPAVIIDCSSLSSMSFDEQVVKHLRVKGADVWFMTFIRDADDVFDAFNTDAETLLAPYHSVASDDDWRDILDVSDSVVFCHKGKAISRKGSLVDIGKTLDSLVSIGFYKNCVVDTDGSIPTDLWRDISEDYPSTVPLTDYTVGLFENEIVPFLI